MPETRRAPALTAEEWEQIGDAPTAKVLPGQPSVFVGRGREVGKPGERGMSLGLPDDRHALAAALLYGQPFGFSHQDVEDVRWAARTLVHYGLTQLADKLAALLPPAAP